MGFQLPKTRLALAPEHQLVARPVRIIGASHIFSLVPKIQSVSGRGAQLPTLARHQRGGSDAEMGASCGPRYCASFVCECQPHARRFRAARHSPGPAGSAPQLGDTLTSSQAAVSSVPPSLPAAPRCSCLWNHATGHQRRAIKANCGGAAWCQGASHPPCKKGVP